MNGSLGEQVARYFDQHRDELLNNWLTKVIAHSDDPYVGLIKTNGSMMLDLVIQSARGETISNDNLQKLASKVSLERLKSNVNMSEFVYNVALGRTEILSHIPKINIPIQNLYPIFDRFNSLFDDFLYHAVHHYTDLKDIQLAEQSLFIEQSHKDKLTILGQMSSSFVHEFRNPLTSVIGFVQLLHSKYPELEYIDILTKELNELKFRITQFLLVSKGGGDQHEKKWFSAWDVFHDTLNFLYPVIVNSNVEIAVHVDESVKIFGYHDGFRQVLINIIMNSIDALSSCTKKSIRLNGYVESGHFFADISNNGPAIPTELRAAIFEPFVSTKKLGTGIGLYVSKKIINDHSGVIECMSDEQETTFRIRIPAEHVASDYTDDIQCANQ